MKRHNEVIRLLAESQVERRCVYGDTNAQRAALLRRAKSGELKRVFRNMYVVPEYWELLDPDERVLHVARTMHHRSPERVFAGLTAAAIHGFEHSWRLHNGRITVLTRSHGVNRRNPKVGQIYAPNHKAEVVRGLPVTNGARTVVDCGMRIGFRYALAIVDSALRSGISSEAIMAECAGMRSDCTPVLRLLRYADDASENGGESLARGTFIEGGVMLPELQRWFADPQTGKSYRVDFVWYLPDGRIIVGEFDGSDKYVDPNMTNGQSIQGVVAAERERDIALRRLGVSKVVHFTYRDVIDRVVLMDKLRRVGIPGA